MCIMYVCIVVVVEVCVNILLCVWCVEISKVFGDQSRLVSFFFCDLFVWHFIDACEYKMDETDNTETQGIKYNIQIAAQAKQTKETQEQKPNESKGKEMKTKKKKIKGKEKHIRGILGSKFST